MYFRQKWYFHLWPLPWMLHDSPISYALIHLCRNILFITYFSPVLCQSSALSSQVFPAYAILYGWKPKFRISAEQNITRPYETTLFFRETSSKELLSFEINLLRRDICLIDTDHCYQLVIHIQIIKSINFLEKYMYNIILNNLSFPEDAISCK
jgi:hypothetical protein